MCNEQTNGVFNPAKGKNFDNIVLSLIFLHFWSKMIQNYIITSKQEGFRFNIV